MTLTISETIPLQTRSLFPFSEFSTRSYLPEMPKPKSSNLLSSWSIPKNESRKRESRRRETRASLAAGGCEVSVGWRCKLCAVRIVEWINKVNNFAGHWWLWLLRFCVHHWPSLESNRTRNRFVVVFNQISDAFRPVASRVCCTSMPKFKFFITERKRKRSGRLMLDFFLCALPPSKNMCGDDRSEAATTTQQRNYRRN